ncbi:MAG TPA: sialidase family protein [Candidatus Hydrogenedentes bacterium]|nr:sialidase family protein [Candidatus Hydrogenedentota bacterium]HOC72522.1 sialidase family protein [Candidatus Hydrogenedentota bacterium]HOH50540.1 sialidase family protein [Candidatus Hydrogenedentota bacterium]HRZ81952.1 sialidase family protein [Candidatus Hydrogenedentota bacterium]
MGAEGNRFGRRTFLGGMAAGGALAGGPAAAAPTDPPPGVAGPPPVLGGPGVAVFESPDPGGVYAYSPGIARLASGRLVATMDAGGPGLEKLPDLPRDDRGKPWRGRIYTSDDHGATWTFRAHMPLLHARPFAAGGAVYVLGHRGDLGIVRSTDNGDTWSAAAMLTQGQSWHQAPCNVHYTRGRVYLVMERKTEPKFKGWAVSVLAPVVMAADVNADLTRRESWTFSSELVFRDAVAQAGPPHLVGVPFFSTGPTVLLTVRNFRTMAPPGWLETNIVQFTDPDHVWHDPAGRTFHLWMRAHTGGTNLAAVAKAVEGEDGQITVSLEKAPSGEPMLYVPCPGGHLKFHILHDEPTGLFWLLSNQSTDSMTRPERLPPDRYSLPNNERHRLVLHFSRNCVDWCFACRVADTGAPGQSRNYAAMAVDGDNLVVLSRSGDHRAKNAHDGNLITFHTVPNFRSLAY